MRNHAERELREAGATFNQILILDSIPVGERNTARELQDDVTIMAAVAPNGGPKVVGYRLESAAGFIKAMELCAWSAASRPYSPLVHLECHGSPEGLKFADGSCLTWAGVRDALIPLNVATELNLIFVVSACHGFDFASGVRVTEPAPVFAFIGPGREMKPHELLKGFSAFYGTYLSTSSAEKGMEALRATAEPGAFLALSTASIFRMVWDAYRSEYLEPSNLAAEAAKMQVRLREQGTEFDLASLTTALRSPLWEMRCREIYFMLDRFPQNSLRFR